jgi:hypothetical protein
MKYIKSDPEDPRWHRTIPHPWCVDVANPFVQILFLFKDKIPSLLNINKAIETGTYEGWTSEFLAIQFKEVFTVEKYVKGNIYNRDINLLENYKILKQNHPNINFYEGDSPIFLKNILSQNPNEQFFILLDAHTSESPVIEELKSIKNFSNRKDHVIIIDDTFDAGTPGWPTQIEMETALLDINKNYNIEYTQYGRRVAVIYEN